MTSSRELSTQDKRRPRRGGRIFAALACAGSLFIPALAGAQRTAADIESARQLFNQGIELRDKGDLKGALEKFRAAHALGNTPVTGVELCKVHAALGQPVEAREVCLGVGRIPPLPQETQRSHEARAEAARIAEAEKSKISALRLKVTGVPAGWEPTVVVDGVTVPPAALGQPRAVNPGMHTVSARVGSGVETKATLETREGETRDVELIVQPPPEGERPVPVLAGGSPPPHPEKKGNPFATVSFVIGGVAALVGTGAGLAAMSAESDLQDKCTNKQCGRELHGELESAKTWGNVSTTFFVVAGLAIGAGVVSTLAAPTSKSGALPPRTASAPKPSKPTITPVLGPAGAGIHGSF
jgi:hypothetical protein